MTDLSANSISNTISKGSVEEDISMFRASMDEAAGRLAEGMKPETISNEKIQKGDELLGTYHITSDAIHGGMGSIWRVHHKNWDTDLAMKRPQPKFFAEGSASRKEEFVAECENWINLGLHPNIVSCYYVRDISGVPSIFSEWMENGSLKDRIQDGSLYEGTEEEVQERILDIAVQTARGLAYSHKNGMIHQDVKPGNLLLTAGWDAKVADFGLARAQSRLTDNNKPVSAGYTLAYCPGEQTEGAPAEPWMDVYAWALTVLEMYAGERFWSSGPAAFSEIFSGRVPAGQNYKVNIPRKLFDAWKTDYDSGSGGWRSFAEYERLLTELYNDISGHEYPRKEADSAENTADSLNNKALSFIDLNRPDEAEMLWEQGLNIVPNHPATVYNQGLYLWRSGAIDDVELLSRISGINEDQQSKKERIGRIQTEGGVLRHYSEENYNPDPQYRVGSDEEKQWIRMAGRQLPGDSVVCAYKDKRTGRIAAGTSEGRLYVIEPDSVNGISFIGHNEKVASVCLHENMLLSSSRNQVKAWDVNTGRCLSTITGEAYYYGFGHIWYDEKDGMIYAQHDATEASGFVFRESGEKASFELNRIQSTSVRLDKDSRFNELCKQAGQLISSEKISEALQKLQEARRVDGYSKDIRVLDLNEEAGKRCHRKGFRGIYQRISLEFDADDFTYAAFSCGGQNLLISGKSHAGCAYYDINTGRLVQDPENTCTDTAGAAADKRGLISIQGNRVIIKDADSGRLIWQADVKGDEEHRNSRLQSACLLPHDRVLACQVYRLKFGWDGIEEYNNLFVVDIATGLETPVRDAKNVFLVSVLPDGSFGMVFNYEHDFMLFSTVDFHFSEKMQLIPKSYDVLYEADGRIYYGDMLRKMEFSPDGRYLLLCGVYKDTAKALVRVFEIDWIYDAES